MWYRKFSLVLSLSLTVLFVLVGCTGTVTRRPVDDEVVKTTDFTEVDIRAMCEKMARSLIEVPQIAHAQTPPTIAFIDMKNRTLQDFDSDNLLGSIRKKLLKYGEGKFVFLSTCTISQRRLRTGSGRRTGMVIKSGDVKLFNLSI